MRNESALLTTIVENASSLADRLAAGVNASGADTSATAEAWLDRWRTLVAAGDHVRFARRLLWDGLDADGIARALGPMPRPTPALPPWADLLGDVIERAGPPPASAGGEAADRALRPDTPRPFEPLLLPFVHIARRRLQARASEHLSLISPAAHGDLEASLLERLAAIAEQALYLEFTQFRLRRPDAWATLQAALAGGGRTAYEAFIHHHRRDGLRSLFMAYPVLGRLLATRTLQWIEATSEFLDRLCADRELLERTFSPHAALAPIAGISANLSDPHRGGRTVSLVRCASGLMLVYKPRSLAPESAFFSLLDWLNGRGLECPLMTPTTVDRGAYGWMEFVTAAGCHDAAEVDRFYHRAGMLLCLAYVLGGTDFHAGNLIAHGEQPVFVDLEVLLRTPLTVQPLIAHQREIGQASVVDTALLPLPRSRPDGASWINGGLVLLEPIAAPRRPSWRHVNTDLMAPSVEAIQFGQAHVPALDGSPCRADDYLGRIVAGFEQMYELLLRRRDELLGAFGPLAVFAQQRVRVVLRPTESYGVLLRQTLQPKYLKSGVDRSLLLDVLKAPALRLPHRPDSWPVLAAEQLELEQLDVPLFEGDGHRRAIATAQGELPGLLSEPGYEGLRARLSALGADDLRRQRHAIRVTFDAAALARAAAPRHSPPYDDHAARLAEADAVAEAARIVDALERLALHSDGGGLTWLGLVTPAGRTHGSLREIGVDLYGGRSGVALFLASFAAATGDSRARRLALQALAPLASGSSRRQYWSDFADRTGIGGGTGIGGVVYALVRAGVSLDAAHLVDTARAAALAITPGRISRDATLDVMGGAAGATLGLLALHTVTDDAAVLARAVLCGRHLLGARVTEPTSGRGIWPSLDSLAASGFAHGAAGATLALARLYGVTGDRAFLESGSDAGQTRQHLAGPSCTWCHGAPGIGLAVLAALTGGAPADGDVLDAALDATIRAPLASVDHLCCGNLGRTELLVYAGHSLGRRDLEEHGAAVATQVVRRARTQAAYATGYHDVFCPGLFQGLAGIGYELLRLHRPDAFPSVLTWE